MYKADMRRRNFIDPYHSANDMRRNEEGFRKSLTIFRWVFERQNFWWDHSLTAQPASVPLSDQAYDALGERIRLAGSERFPHLLKGTLWVPVEIRRAFKREDFRGQRQVVASLQRLIAELDDLNAATWRGSAFDRRDWRRTSRRFARPTTSWPAPPSRPSTRPPPTPFSVGSRYSWSGS